MTRDTSGTPASRLVVGRRRVEPEAREEALHLIYPPVARGELIGEFGGELADLLRRVRLITVEEAARVIPGDVIIGVRIERRLVDRRFPRLEQLLEVPGEEVPCEEMVLVAIGAIEHRTFDPFRPEDLL